MPPSSTPTPGNTSENPSNGVVNHCRPIGRSQTQRVRYELMAQHPDHPLTTEQLTLVGRLKNVGVSDGQAQRFVRGNRDAAQMALAEAVVAATTQFKKSRGALAWDVLTDTKGRCLVPWDLRRLRSLPPSLEHLSQ